MVTGALGGLKQGICGIVLKRGVFVDLPIINNNKKFWEEQIAYFIFTLLRHGPHIKRRV
jgi:hypothetical protein